MKLHRTGVLFAVLFGIVATLYGARLIVTFRSNTSAVMQRRAHQKARAQMISRRTTPWIVEVESADPTGSIARYGRNPIVASVHTVTNTPTSTPTNTPTNTPTTTPTATLTNTPG